MQIAELSSTETHVYHAAMEEEKTKVRPEAEAIKEERIRTEAPKLAEIRHISEGKAVEVLRSRSAGYLTDEDIIVFKTLGKVAVSDTLADPKKYDKQYCADPMEPEEGTSKALFHANLDSTGAPLVHSMLHGGQNYYLKKDTQAVSEVSNHVQKAGGKSKSSVILELNKAVTAEGIAKEVWCGVIASACLNRTDLDAVLSFLADTLKTKKTLLKREYQEYQKQTWADESFRELREIAGNRKLIEYIDYDLNKATKKVEKAILDVPGVWPYFNYGNVLSFSTYETPQNRSSNVDGEQPPKIPVIRQYNRDNLCLRLEQSALHYKLKEDKETGVETAGLIPTPQALISKLLEHPEPLAPRVSGLVTHPILDLDGRVIDEECIDDTTGILLQFGGSKFIKIPDNPSLEVANKAARTVFALLFSEFMFKESPVQPDLYKNAALSMLMTGLFRKVIDQAPAYMIVANLQGSGKTTLARIVHNILTGRDMPVSSLGGSSEEMKKEMLAMLLQSPAMVCYDNILDGSEINDPILAKVITGQMYKGRILGKTQEATVPTNTLIAVTGNNITLSADLVRRFSTIYLTADSSKPETRTYKTPDIVKTCLKYRRRVISECMVITKAYINAGCPLSNGEVESSGFTQWDCMIRFPLLWATGVDVLASITENRQQSNEVLGMAKVLSCLSELFGNESFTASTLMGIIQDDGDPDELVESLKEGLIHMSSKSVSNARSLAWVLKKLEGRMFENMVLRQEHIRNRSDRFWIEYRQK